MEYLFHYIDVYFMNNVYYVCVCMVCVCCTLCWGTFSHVYMHGEQELYLSPDMRITIWIICAETLRYISLMVLQMFPPSPCPTNSKVLFLIHEVEF